MSSLLLLIGSDPIGLDLFREYLLRVLLVESLSNAIVATLHLLLIIEALIVLFLIFGR